jgi:phosphotransferase system HPr (HPr) family protein
MNEPRATRTVTVSNRGGFHLRALSLFSDLARRFECQIEVAKGRQSADGKSLLDLGGLGAAKGDQLVLEAVGNDADAALEALVELITYELFEEDEPNPFKVNEGRVAEDALNEDPSPS